jgi:hypothetical protein
MFVLIVLLSWTSLSQIPLAADVYQFETYDACQQAKLAVAAVMQEGTVLCARKLSEVSRGPVTGKDK